jgi:hypothetical protein
VTIDLESVSAFSNGDRLGLHYVLTSHRSIGPIALLALHTMGLGRLCLGSQHVELVVSRFDISGRFFRSSESTHTPRLQETERYIIDLAPLWRSKAAMLPQSHISSGAREFEHHPLLLADSEIISSRVINTG